MSRPTYPELYARARDAVKERVARWPSAYASAQLVRVYKALVSARHGPRARPYDDEPTNRPHHGLAHWFGEKWVDISTMRPCGSVKTGSYYPTCRPKRIAKQLTPVQIVDAVARKQRSKSRTTRYAWVKNKNP